MAMTVLSCSTLDHWVMSLVLSVLNWSLIGWAVKCCLNQLNVALGAELLGCPGCWSCSQQLLGGVLFSDFLVGQLANCIVWDSPEGWF